MAMIQPDQSLTTWLHALRCASSTLDAYRLDLQTNLALGEDHLFLLALSAVANVHSTRVVPYKSKRSNSLKLHDMWWSFQPDQLTKLHHDFHANTCNLCHYEAKLCCSLMPACST